MSQSNSTAELIASPSGQSPPEPASSPLREWGSAHRGWIIAFIVVAAMRLWFAIVGVVAVLDLENAKMVEVSQLYWGIAPTPMHGNWLLLTPWQRWDAIWYLHITTFGYSVGNPSASFFPLFPVLMRALGFFLNENYLLAGTILCTLATFLSFGLLYSITADCAGKESAARAVWYWAIFPAGFYLFGGYAESVMTACSVASVYFAQRRNWWIAGVAAMGATLSRPVALIIALPLAIMAWQQSRVWRDRLFALVLSSAGIAIGFGGWMLYLYIMFNDAMLWTHAQDFWTRVFVFPWDTIGWTVQNIMSYKWHWENNVADLSLTAIAFLAILICLRRMPFAYSAYALVLLIVPLTSYAIRDEFWATMPMAAAARRALVVFPAFIALGSTLRSRWLFGFWSIASLAAGTVMFFEYAKWIWVD